MDCITAIGHIMTTVLVDRGDASHRITLTKNEIIRDGDYGFEFTEQLLLKVT